MREQQITAIILAATEMGGMGDDYFERKTRHLLPIADKPLIQHLIETVDKCKQIGEKHIIIEEKVEENGKIEPCEEVYKSVFGDRVGDDIKLEGQEPLAQAGTFEAVKEYIEGEDKKESIFPILVLYGDTLVEEKFLERIVNQYGKENEESKIVWGLAESKKERGKFVITNYIDINNDFVQIDGDDIRNIFEYPIIGREKSYTFLHDTGIMAISKDSWDNINKLIDRIHRPSPLGLFSFTSIIKQALVFKNIEDVNIEIIGVVAPEDQWHEANYPWEILELNKTKISDSVKDGEWAREKERSISIQEDTEWTEEKEEEIGQKNILVQDNVKFTMTNGARIKGPCFLGKNIKIRDYAIIENSYIGDGCEIGEHAVILDSTLVKSVTVHPHATIEKSIIMENSKVYYHAEVLHSIVGKEVMIGSGVKTPCQRLKRVHGKPYVTYFSDTGIKKTDKFGAIIGDYCQIGSGTVIHPGRRVGKQSNISANCEILKNIKPDSNIRNKDMVEEYE